MPIVLRCACTTSTRNGWWVLLTIASLCCGRSDSTSPDRGEGAANSPVTATRSSAAQDGFDVGSGSARAVTESYSEEATVVRPPCTFVLRCSAENCDVDDITVTARPARPRSSGRPGEGRIDLRCDPMAEEHRGAVLDTMADLIKRGASKWPDATSRDFKLRMNFAWHGTMVMRWAAVLRRSSWWRHVERWEAVSWRGIDDMMKDSDEIFSEYDKFISGRGYRLKDVRIDKILAVEAWYWSDTLHRLEKLGYLPGDLVVIPAVVDLVFAPTG